MSTTVAACFAICMAAAFLIGSEAEKIKAADRQRRKLLGSQRRRRAAREKREDFRRHMQQLASQAKDMLHLSVTSVPVKSSLKLLATEPGHAIIIPRMQITCSLVTRSGIASVSVMTGNRDALRDVFQLLAPGPAFEVIIPPAPPVDGSPRILLDGLFEGGHDAAGS